MDLEVLEKRPKPSIRLTVCLVVNGFIDSTDERERLLRVAINCKFSDAVRESLESLPEVGLPVFEAPLPEND